MATPNLAEFDALASPHRKKECAIAAALPALTDGDREAVIYAIAQDKARVPAGAIEKWFARRGHTKVNGPTVVHHRAGRCTCADG